MKLIKREDVLWLRHLREVDMPVPPGRAALFRLNACEILFEPMRPGRGGWPTPGLRVAEANREVWSRIPKGMEIDLKLIRVHDDGPAPSVDLVANPHGSFRDSGAERQTNSDRTNGLLDAVELPPSRITTFDAYLMVDWSAASKRRTGKDSVWWCVCTWRRGRLAIEANKNPPTRQACFDAVRQQLRELVASGSRVLVAFDFPYGYPFGFARMLGLGGTAWRAIWKELSSRVVDEVDNTNNRFRVANDLNAMSGASEGPFWGHPPGQMYLRLHATEPTYPVRGLTRLRETERHARGAQPIWKLWGNGSVGGQALLGLPFLARLRDDKELRESSRVWPFETGCTLPLRDHSARIVFAEIYPSLVRLAGDFGGRVIDAKQVEATARYLARHDAEGTLGNLFTAPARLETTTRHRVEVEEGWILGVVP